MARFCHVICHRVLHHRLSPGGIGKSIVAKSDYNKPRLAPPYQRLFASAAIASSLVETKKKSLPLLLSYMKSLSGLLV